MTTSKVNIMSTALQQISGKLSSRFGMGDNTLEVIEILKSTAFKGGTAVSDAQMTALMIVADQYSLNPWTREIYAFPDKGGIVPVVGVDGWSRIINEHPQFDGLEFNQDDESCTCVMYRKDRGHAIKVTEWLSECKRATQPWQSHPKRMLRHKALIQCARLAFGFVGIYDQDEAERIIENPEREINNIPAKQKPETKQLEFCSDENFEEKSLSWLQLVKTGKKTGADIINMIETKYLFTTAQKDKILSWNPAIEGELLEGEA